MCGIAGFVTSKPANPDLLRQMCDAVRHRGPDDDGYMVKGHVALGMRRLAIIDLHTGKQPIANEDGSVTVVFNGEIYNFPELRRELQSKGHRFKTNTDTECIVHLYEELGERCVARLRGMFAFALWDDRAQRLFIARDRVGKKPLVYWAGPEGICFGSELKSLLQFPGFPRQVDPVSLHHYLSYGYVPAPRTIYPGVQKLLPGHVLIYEDGKVKTTRYWELHYMPKRRITEEAAAAEVGEKLREATAIRLISDRPVGAFLSGGIDSSLVVAAMAEATSTPVRTFSIGFDDAKYDERHFARLVSERFGTDHREFIVRPSALEVLPTLTWHYDEPFADSSAIPSYYVARMAREEVTVVLNGDGGDESFAGYERYVANAWANRINLPVYLRPLFQRVVRRFPAGQPKSYRNKLKKLLELLPALPDQRYALLMSAFDNERKAALYTGDMRHTVSGIDSYGLLGAAFASSDAPDQIDRTLSADVATYLPDDLLFKMDIASMANSLEARSPLLDHELMELAASLPSDFKLRRMVTKHVLKQLGEGWLPESVVTRRKMGFGVPMASWLRGELRELRNDVLTDSVARGRGYFDPSVVQGLLGAHDRGIDHSARIWALLQFELWHRLFVDGRPSVMPPRQPLLSVEEEGRT